MIKNKKGIMDDFGSLLISGLLIAAMAIAILIYSGLMEKSYQARPLTITNLEEASYTTRTILEWELENGMKIHEAIIKYDSENNLTGFTTQIQKTLTKQDLLPRQNWLILINTPRTNEPRIYITEEEQFKELAKTPTGITKILTFGDKSTRELEQIRNSILALTRVTIPDGENSIIEVVIKQIKTEDLELYTSMKKIQ